MGLHTEKPEITTMVASGEVIKRRFVKYSGARCTARGELAVGVSRDETQDTTKAMAVATGGTVLVEAGEALSVGDEVTTDAAGKAVIAYDTEYINGVVMRAQTEVGQLVEVRLGGYIQSTLPTTSTTTTTTTTGE